MNAGLLDSSACVLKPSVAGTHPPSLSVPCCLPSSFEEAVPFLRQCSTRVCHPHVSILVSCKHLYNSPVEGRSFLGQRLPFLSWLDPPRLCPQELLIPEQSGRLSAAPGSEVPMGWVPPPVGAGAGIFVNHHDKTSDDQRNTS